MVDRNIFFICFPPVKCPVSYFGYRYHFIDILAKVNYMKIFTNIMLIVKWVAVVFAGCERPYDTISARLQMDLPYHRATRPFSD